MGGGEQQLEQPLLALSMTRIVLSKKYDTFQSVSSCLMCNFSWTIAVHFVRLTATMTWVNDRWSDDHVGMVVIRCRSH